jgi:sugar lactone lactonase YvrE
MENKIADNLSIVSSHRATLGENPLWDAKNKLFYWVDIIEKNFFILNTCNGICSSVNMESLGINIGSIALRNNGGLILATNKGIHLFDQDILSLKLLSDPENDLEQNRFNDGKCDILGRFWVGSTSCQEKDPLGSLYCLDGELKIRKVLTGIIISNGITWSIDNKIMYYIDSPTRKIRAFDFDIKTGSLSNERAVIVLPEVEGYPDGMTTDEEGNLWVAHWGGYKVGRWNPFTGEMIDKIEIPVKRVSSVTFGGDNLDELYITTAIRGFGEQNNLSEIKPGKYDGMVFKAKLQFRGLTTNRFCSEYLDSK